MRCELASWYFYQTRYQDMKCLVQLSCNYHIFYFNLPMSIAIDQNVLKLLITLAMRSNMFYNVSHTKVMQVVIELLLNHYLNLAMSSGMFCIFKSFNVITNTGIIVYVSQNQHMRQYLITSAGLHKDRALDPIIGQKTVACVPRTKGNFKNSPNRYYRKV